MEGLKRKRQESRSGPQVLNSSKDFQIKRGITQAFVALQQR